MFDLAVSEQIFFLRKTQRGFVSSAGIEPANLLLTKKTYKPQARSKSSLNIQQNPGNFRAVASSK